MADSKEEIFKFLELNPNEDWDQVKAEFNKKFVRADADIIGQQRPDLHGQIVGKLNGGLKVALKRLGKDVLGRDLTEDELDQETGGIAETIRTEGKKRLGEFETNVTTLQTKLEKAKSGSPEKVQKLETDLEQITGKYNQLKTDFEQTDTALKTKTKEFDEFQQQIEGSKRTSVLDNKKSEIFSAAKIKANSDFERNGYLSDWEKRYKIDLEGESLEDSQLVIRDKAGKKIEDPDKAGVFLSPDEVLKRDAIKDKMYDDGDTSGKTVRTGRRVIATDDDDDDKKNNVVVSPYLRK